MLVHGHRGHEDRHRTPTYISWMAMKQRVLNPNHDRYPVYGGRGIKIDPRWMIFENFLADMGHRPLLRTLDRRDVNGDYTKSNCKWATDRQQRKNKRGRDGI